VDWLNQYAPEIQLPPEPEWGGGILHEFFVVIKPTQIME
jgi:hypothetical protein